MGKMLYAALARSWGRSWVILEMTKEMDVWRNENNVHGVRSEVSERTRCASEPRAQHHATVSSKEAASLPQNVAYARLKGKIASSRELTLDTILW